MSAGVDTRDYFLWAGRINSGGCKIVAVGRPRFLVVILSSASLYHFFGVCGDDSVREYVNKGKNGREGEERCVNVRMKGTEERKKGKEEKAVQTKIIVPFIATLPFSVVYLHTNTWHVFFLQSCSPMYGQCKKKRRNINTRSTIHSPNQASQHKHCNAHGSLNMYTSTTC